MIPYHIQATASSALRKCNSSVQNAWYNLKQTGFRAFLDRQGSEREANSSQYSRSVYVLGMHDIDQHTVVFMRIGLN